MIWNYNLFLLSHISLLCLTCCWGEFEVLDYRYHQLECESVSRIPVDSHVRQMKVQFRFLEKTQNISILVRDPYGDIYKHYAIENEVNGESILIEEPKPGLWEFQPNMKLRDIGCEITFYGHSDLRFDLKFTTINHRPQCDRQMHLFPESDSVVVLTKTPLKKVPELIMGSYATSTFTHHSAVQNAICSNENVTLKEFENKFGPIPNCILGLSYFFKIYGVDDNNCNFTRVLERICTATDLTTSAAILTTDFTQGLTLNLTTNITSPSNSSTDVAPTHSNPTTESPSTESSTGTTESTSTESSTRTTESTSTASSTTTTYSTSTKSSTLTPADETSLSELKHDITAQNVGEKLIQLTKILTGIGGQMTEGNVTDTVDILISAANINGISVEVGRYFDKSVDLTLSKGYESFTYSSTDKLLLAMKNYSLNVNLTVGQSSEFYDGKLFVHVVTMISCENLEFQIGIADFIHGEDRSAMPISNILWQTSNYSVDVSALIAIQPTVVCPKRSKATKLAFQLYRNVKIFQSKNQKVSLTGTYCTADMKLGDTVVSAAIIQRLDNSIEPQVSAQIEFRRKSSQDEQRYSRSFRHNCGHWQDGWQANTDVTQQYGESYKFEVDYLSDFALIVSNNPKNTIFCAPGTSIINLTGATLSAIVLSLVAGVLAVIKYLAPREQVTLEPNTALEPSYPVVFLVIWLMLFFFFFDILADQTTLSIDDSACSAVAGIRYYLLVSSMALSISHGVSLYRKAYGITTKDLFHRISILISTGAPLLLVMIVGLADRPFFERSDFNCWVNQAYSNWAVGVPSVLLWIIGATMIALIIRNQYNENQIAQENGNQATETRNKACRGTVKKIAAIIILLGVPWLFRLLADIPDEDWLIYLFTIVNTFQGSAVAAALTYQYRKKILKLIKSIPVCRTRVTPEVVNVNVPTDGTLPRSSLTVTTIDPSTV